MNLSGERDCLSDMENGNKDRISILKESCENEKAKATKLAGEYADELERIREYDDKLSKIKSNPFYKLSRKLKHPAVLLEAGKNPFMKASGEDAPEDIRKDYEERYGYQKNPYSLWIRKKEPILYAEADTRLTAARDEALKNCEVRPFSDLKNIRFLSEIAGLSITKRVYVFAKNPEYLDESALIYAYDYFSRNPDAALWYADEDYTDASGERRLPFFKQDYYRDSLLGYFLFGSFVAVNVSKAENLLLLSEDDEDVCIYDLCLQLTFSRTGGYGVGHSPLVLYHIPAEEKHLDEISEDYKYAANFWGYEEKYINVKIYALRRIGVNAKGRKSFRTDIGSVYPITMEYGTVSIVIPTKDHPEELRKCIDSIIKLTDYPRLELLIVDNGSAEAARADIEEYIQKIRISAKIKRAEYIYEPGKFNFSAMCNRGEREARGEYILLLNDDTEVIEEDWLKIMAGQASVPGTGAVGARLLYPDGITIQHAGITNMQVGPSHKLATFPEDRFHYYGYGSCNMNMLAVTGACLLVKKTVYDEIGGLNEDFPVAYNDVEFCVRLQKSGLLNVQRNDAVLIHHESLSRGADADDSGKWKRLMHERRKLYELHPEFEGHDPYYSNGLKGNCLGYEVNYMFPWEERIKTVERVNVRKTSGLSRKEYPLISLNMDSVETQKKYDESETDVLCAEGWSYMEGADNSRFERFFVLNSDDATSFIYPIFEKYRHDVENMLSGERNTGLSGFVCSIRKNTLHTGSWGMGVLYRDMVNGKEYYRKADGELII